jgi:CheY-like chemotaxis protein
MRTRASCFAGPSHGRDIGWSAFPTAATALSSVLANTPDLILLDLLMPEMDGTDLVEILRSYLRLHTLPIVVITAAPESPQAYRAKRQR